MRQGCRKASVCWTDSTPNTQVVQEPSSCIGALTVRQAGKMGGLAWSRNHGRGFYVGIGRRGQHVLRSRHPDKAREWGRMGGRPRKLTLEQIMGQASESEQTRECGSASYPCYACPASPLLESHSRSNIARMSGGEPGLTERGGRSLNTTSQCAVSPSGALWPSASPPHNQCRHSRHP